MKASTVVFGSIVVAGVQAAPFFGAPDDLSLSALVGRDLTPDSVNPKSNLALKGDAGTRTPSNNGQGSTDRGQAPAVGMNMKMCANVVINGVLTQDCSAREQKPKDAPKGGPKKPAEKELRPNNGGQGQHHDDQPHTAPDRPHKPETSQCDGMVVTMKARMQALQRDNDNLRGDVATYRRRAADSERKLAVYQSNKDGKMHLTTRDHSSSADMEGMLGLGGRRQHDEHDGHRNEYSRDDRHQREHDHHAEGDRHLVSRDNHSSSITMKAGGSMHIDEDHADYRDGDYKEDYHREKGPRKSNQYQSKDSQRGNPGGDNSNGLEREEKYYGDDLRGDGMHMDQSLRKEGDFGGQSLKKDGDHIGTGMRQGGEDFDKGLRNGGTKFEKGFEDGGKAFDKDVHNGGKQFDKDAHQSGKQLDKGIHDDGKRLDNDTHKGGDKLDKDTHSDMNDVDDDLQYNGKRMDYTLHDDGNEDELYGAGRGFA